MSEQPETAPLEPPETPTALATPWLDGADDEISMSLADFIEKLGEGVDIFNEAFARRIAATLEARAAYIRMPAVERFELVDVVATLYMDKRMRMVVTGQHDETLAEVTLRWDGRDFDSVGLKMARAPHETAYTFATLDFSVRDREATLLEAVGPWALGQKVTIRCLSSIGPDVHYRCLEGGHEIAVRPDQLEVAPVAAE